jgi:hypothetical protein
MVDIHTSFSDKLDSHIFDLFSDHARSCVFFIFDSSSSAKDDVRDAIENAVVDSLQGVNDA